MISEFTRELKSDMDKFHLSLAILQQKSQIVSQRLKNSEDIRKKIKSRQRESDFMTGMSWKKWLFTIL